jgi:hypothetical protein
VERSVLALVAHETEKPLVAMRKALESQRVLRRRARSCQEMGDQLASGWVPHLIFNGTEVPYGTWVNAVLLAAASGTGPVDLKGV